MRCLVIQTAYLGDVILTMPLVSILAAADGVEHVAALAAPAGADFLATQTVVDEVITYDKRGSEAGPGGMASVVGCIRASEADVALIPHRSFRSALIARSARVPRRIGFDESGGSFLLTDVVPYRAKLHEAERCASLAEPIAGPLPDGRVPFVLSVPGGAVESVEAGLAAAGWDGRGIVVLAPGSRWPTKRWFPERFAAVADGLSSGRGLLPVLAGSEDDAAQSAAVAAAANGPIVDLTGSLSMGEWLALMRLAKLAVCNDSAAGHAAAGVGTPVVSVFGPTVVEQGFAPYSDTARVVSAPVECRPCGRHGSERCSRGTLECLVGVTASGVLEAADGLLSVPGSGVV